MRATGTTVVAVTAAAWLCAMMTTGFVASCSGHTDTTGAGGSGPTVDEACAAIAVARCKQLDSCTAAKGVTIRFGDEATCEARHTLQCKANLAANGTSATPAGFERCASALPTEACQDFLDNVQLPECTPQPGVIANGGPCLASGQCMSAFCQTGKGVVCGECAAMPLAGSPCETGEGDCSRGLVCVKATSQCEAPALEGAMCNKSQPCAAGLSCVGATATTSGTCEPAASKIGAKCDATRATAPDCDRDIGLYCNPTTNTCAAVTYVSAGQPCGATTSGFAVCTAGADCITGTCVAPAADGAACDDATGPGCLFPAKCVLTADGGTAGKCEVPDPTACK